MNKCLFKFFGIGFILFALVGTASAQKHSVFLRKSAIAVNDNDGSLSLGLEKTLNNGILHKLQVGYERWEMNDNNTSHTLSVGAVHYLWPQFREHLNLSATLSAYAGVFHFEPSANNYVSGNEFTCGVDGTLSLEYPVKNVSFFADLRGRYIADHHYVASNVGIGVKYHF